MKKADNFNASKWLIENKITTQSKLNEVEVPSNLNPITKKKFDNLIAMVEKAVANKDQETLYKIYNKGLNTGSKGWGYFIDSLVDKGLARVDDRRMLKFNLNESKLNEDLTDEIAALPDFNTAMDREKSELIVGKYAVVRYDESGEGGENMYVVWDNTVNQDEIGSYDDVPEFESEDPAEVAAWLKQNESLNENEKISIENHKDEALETISDFIEEFEPQGLFEFIPSLDNYEIDSSTNSINIDELGSVYLIPNKGPVPNEVKELMMDSNNGEMNEDGATWKKYPKNGYYYIVVS